MEFESVVRGLDGVDPFSLKIIKRMTIRVLAIGLLLDDR